MNLVLGDVVETIYVVDEDDDDKEDIRVCFTFTSHTVSRYVLTSALRPLPRSRRCYLFEVCVLSTSPVH